MRSMIDLATIASLIGSPHLRHLQELPDYTSPPTDYALAATPEAFRDDAVIDAGRAADANRTCFTGNVACQIPFPPPQAALDTAKLGVVFYGGALVDPRGYSPVAKELSERYGMAVAIQIFEDDLPFKRGSCNTARLDLAEEEFPYIEKWVLVGHSLGGIAAMTDVWTLVNGTDKIAGLVLLASYIRDDLGCGEVDFSSTSMPMASINASLDGVVNATSFLSGQPLLPVNDTFHMEILGGNHGQFGSYNDSERTTLLGQVDGNATIPETVQQDLAVGAIANVAARSGIPLAMWDGTVNDNTSGGSHGRLGRLAVASAIIAYFVVI